MRTLQTPRSAARTALVLLSLVLCLGSVAGVAVAAERNAGNGPGGDDLTRYEIAEWHDKLYESTNALNSSLKRRAENRLACTRQSSAEKAPS